jgi:hypothetical protein
MAYDENGNLVPDPIPASLVLGETVIPNHPVLAQLKEQIETLTGQRDSWITDHNIMRDRWVNAKAAIEALKSNVKNLILENHDNVDEDFLKELAEAMEIELTKSISVQGTINFSGSVEVSIFEDLDDISYNVSVDGLDISAYGENLWHLDYDVEDVTSEDN